MAELLQDLNARAPDILRTLGLMEAQIVILALFVLAIERLMRQPLPKLRYALWLVVLAKSLLPPLLKIPQPEVIPADFYVFSAAILRAAERNEMALNSYPSIAAMILALWFVASLSLAAIAWRRFWSLRAQLRDAQPCALSETLVTTPAFRSWPSLWRSEKLATPIALGWFRPRIYLNTAAASDPAILPAVLYHELAHVLRRDGWIVLLQTLAQILHPFNPLVWMMNVRLCRYREQICDDFALRHTNVEPQRYGEMLLRFLEAKSFSLFATPGGTGFFETKNGYQQRLQYLLSTKESAMNRWTWKQKLALAGLALALLPASWQCGHKMKSPATPATADAGSLVLVQNPHQAEKRIPLTPAEAEILQRLENDLRAINKKSAAAIEKTKSDPAFRQHQQQQARELEELRAEIVKALKEGRALPSQQTSESLAAETAPTESRPPEPDGGLLALQQHLVYPDAARAAKIEGVVFLQILVLENGEIGEIKILKTPAENVGLEEAAAAAVKSVKWKPAMALGKPIKSWIGLPVEFSLNK
jgi:TonB family protein